MTTLREFAAGEVEGVSVLTLGSDGNFYGTSYARGANRLGSVIRLTPGGALQILYSFSGPDGAYPRGGVLRLTDGTLLGTAEMAGPRDGGVVFSLTPSGCTPPAAVASGTAAICAGQSTPLTGSGGVSCSWSPATGLSNAASCNPTASPSATTVYTLTVTDGTGCVSTNDPTVTVTVNPLPAAPVVTAPGTVGQGSPNRTASVPNHAGSTYAWTIGNGTIRRGRGRARSGSRRERRER